MARGTPDFIRAFTPSIEVALEHIGPMKVLHRMVDPELKEIGNILLAADKYGRIILSQYDYAHFEEKLAWNPIAGHFWHHFKFLPDKERDISYYGTPEIRDSYIVLPPGSGMSSHQQFIYAIFRTKAKVPLPTSGVWYAFGFYEIHSDEYVPVPTNVGAYFRITDVEAQARIEYRGGEDYAIITLPPDAETKDHIYTIEVYLDLVKFWVDNTLVASFIPLQPGLYQFPWNSPMAFIHKNDGSAGQAEVDLVTVDPLPLNIKAPRSSLRGIAIPTTEGTLHGYSCVLDRIIVVNSKPYDIQVNIKDGEGSGIFSDLVPAMGTSSISLGGAPMRWGVRGVADADGAYLWAIGGF